MRQLWKVAKWEVMRNLTNKQFLIGLLLTPLLMAVFGGLPALLERWNQPATSTYYVVDQLEAVPALQKALPENVVLKEYEDLHSVAAAVEEDKASGYFLLSADFLRTGQLDLWYNERNTAGLSALNQALSTVLQQARLKSAEIDQQELAFLTAPAQVSRRPMEEDLEPESLGMIATLVFTVLVFFLILTSSSMLMYSALQEKRDRMAEVILSSIKPIRLMQGKILGHFLLGVIQLSFWLLLGIPLAVYLLEFPVLEAVAAVNFPVLLFFGLCGFLMFSTIFVSLGATMEDIQSTGNAQGLVVMLPMLSFLFIAPVATNPDGTVALFASFFPITSPAITMIRSGLTKVPLWQFLTSGALLLVSTWLIVNAASKIFRTGMLLYGKNATLGEVLKWLRYKEH